MQAAIAALLVLLAGTPAGRSAFDSMLHLVGQPGLPWEQFGGGFETLVIGSAPLFWTLTLLTGIAALLLRYRDRNVERPFSMPMFPLPAIVFCGHRASTCCVQASCSRSGCLLSASSQPQSEWGSGSACDRTARPTDVGPTNIVARSNATPTCYDG